MTFKMLRNIIKKIVEGFTLLDYLYDNIGGKIKNLAKWLFIVVAIVAIIRGFVLLFTDVDYSILSGLLTLVCGPIFAWISSWILFAFGQLVEDVHAIRDKEGTTEEVKSKRESTTSIKGHSPTQKAKQYMAMGVTPEKVGTGYICPVCKMAMDSMSPGERCNYVPPMTD